MKIFLKELLSSSNKISSKRFITILTLVMIVVSWAMDMFFNKTISEFIWNGLMTILGIGLGTITMTSVFGKNKKSSNSDEEENGQ